MLRASPRAAVLPAHDQSDDSTPDTKSGPPLIHHTSAGGICSSDREARLSALTAIFVTLVNFSRSRRRAAIGAISALTTESVCTPR